MAGASEPDPVSTKQQQIAELAKQDPHMGFFSLVSTFEQRMARFNQALDRHTNWGPTGYYMEDASPSNASSAQIRYIGAYSPIVACSYDISASNAFASGDYPTTPQFEQGMTKWMFVMKFRADNYYDEVALRALIDACRPYEMLGEFPPVVKATAELRGSVAKKFADQLRRKR